MPESTEELLSILHGLLVEQGGILSQMEYVQEMIHDPLARSCNASRHLGRTVESNNSSGSRKMSSPSATVPVNISFALYWDIFANFSLLCEAYGKLHRLLESLCKAITASTSLDKNVLNHSIGALDTTLDHSIAGSYAYKRFLTRSASVCGLYNTSAKHEKDLNGASSQITHQRVQSLSCIPLSARESASPKKKKFLNLSIHSRQKSVSTRGSSSTVLKKAAPQHGEKKKGVNAPLGINSDPQKGSSFSGSKDEPLRNGARRNVNPVDLVVEFFTSNEMKEFMLQHLMYMDHFARHITHRVVDMRRIWNRVYIYLPSKPTQKLESSLNGLTNEEKDLVRNYEGSFNFLFSLLGINGHPTDPRVSRSHFPEGSRYANKPQVDVMSPARWEGFEVLLVLLATPAPVLCRYLFRARCIIESKVLEASSPGAAQRLKDGFIDLATKRISETYSVVVESIARRDVEMMVALFDRSAMINTSKSKSSGFFGLYFSGASASADNSADSFICMVKRLEEKSWISPTTGSTIVSSVTKNNKSNISLPFFELWKGLNTSTGRNLLYCGQLHVTVSQNFKRMKVVPRLVFLFSDSLVCAEEIPSNGLLRMQSFLLLQDASVRSLHNCQNLTVDEIECARKLEAYPNAFVVSSAFGGKLFLITDTSEERHYWVKTVQRAIRHQPRLRILREESKASGEPVAHVAIHGQGLPISSRLARQRRDDSGLQFEFQHLFPVAEVGTFGRGHASAIATNGSVTSTILSRFNSFSGAAGLPPARGSCVKRELSETNWAVLGSVHGRMGSLSVRHPQTYRLEDGPVSGFSDSRLPACDVPPVPRKPVTENDAMGGPSQPSLVRFNSFRCTGLDRTIASNPPVSDIGPVNSPNQGNEESDHQTSESTSSRSTSLFGALETVLDFPRPSSETIDQVMRKKVVGNFEDVRGVSERFKKEGSPSVSHSPWIRRSASSSSSSVSLSSEFSFSSTRQEKQIDADGGFFGVPMSAFQRSKRRDPNCKAMERQSVTRGMSESEH